MFNFTNNYGDDLLSNFTSDEQKCFKFHNTSVSKHVGTWEPTHIAAGEVNRCNLSGAQFGNNQERWGYLQPLTQDMSHRPGTGVNFRSFSDDQIGMLLTLCDDLFTKAFLKKERGLERNKGREGGRKRGKEILKGEEWRESLGPSHEVLLTCCVSIC